MSDVMRIEEVMEVTTLAKSTIYSWVKSGKFPPQKKIGGTSVWLKSDIQDWMNKVLNQGSEEN